MKNRIIVKKGKNYLAGYYREFDWLALLGMLTVVMFVALGVYIFFSPPTMGSAGDKYLEIDDASQDYMGYSVVGNVYVWEPMISGGFHDSGDRMVVSVSEFVYNQLEEGSVISLSIDSRGEYQYGGDIYGSVDSFISVDDFLDSTMVICVFLMIYVTMIALTVVSTKRGAEVVTLSGAEIIKKIRTWYGMYSYLRCNEGLFRLKDEYVYITCDVGDLLYMDKGDDTFRLYALRENLKRIKNKHLRLDDLMNDVEANP